MHAGVNKLNGEIECGGGLGRREREKNNYEFSNETLESLISFHSQCRQMKEEKK